MKTAMLLISVIMGICLVARAEEPQQTKWDAPPAMQIDVNKKYNATIDTSKGKINIELFPKEAPKTVNNFVFLAKQHFYDGTEFHRVIPNFMIQGGDRNGKPAGTGDAGYKFENENKDSARTFGPGTVAMANAGPDTNGCQFFINDGASPWLKPASYTIFGQVTQGQEVVKAIASVDKDENDHPHEAVVMKSVTIEEK